MSTKLKICNVGSASSCHIQNRVQCFADRGHIIHFISEEHFPEMQAVHQLSPLSQSKIPKLRVILDIANYFRIFHQISADIIHVHFARSRGAWIAAAMDYHPLIVSTMGGDVLWDERGGIHPLERWLTLQVFENADLITSKSDHITAVLDELGRYGKKAIKVVWGVDTRQFRRTDVPDLRRHLGLLEEDLVILSPKRLKPLFNIHLIIEAMVQVLKVHSKAKLLLTEYQADPCYKAEVMALIDSLELQKHIILIGEIKHEDMPRYYSLADIVIGIPSSDGLPQTLFEAMACSVPHILSRLPRYEEVVKHAESAYFVDICSQSIADGIIRLFSDSKLREMIKVNGLNLVQEQADFQTEVSRVEQEYYRLLAGTKKQTSLLKSIKIFTGIILFYTLSKVPIKIIKFAFPALVNIKPTTSNLSV